MDICSSYNIEFGKTVCYGTKEREACNCEGDESKCNFYPEKREKANKRCLNVERRSLILTELYSMTRQSGKTTMLIEMSAKTGAIIVVPTHVMRNYILGMANKLNLKIPEPISVREFIRAVNSNWAFNEQKYLIDELQTVLTTMNVAVATIDRNHVHDDFNALKTAADSEVRSSAQIETEYEPTF